MPPTRVLHFSVPQISVPIVSTVSIPHRSLESKRAAHQANLRGVDFGRRSPGSGAHCLTRNVTEEVSADDWGSAAESGRWRAWRELSAWARGERFCRRWRSATGRRGGWRRGASSTRCAGRRAGIAPLGLMDRADPLNELVAKKIIEIAKTGERNPSRLRDRALKSLQS